MIRAGVWRRMKKVHIYIGGRGDFGYLTPADTGEMEYVSLVDKIPEEHRVFA